MAFKRIITKLNIALFMLVFTAGVIFFVCAFSDTLPKNVTVNGVDVGGLTREEAARLVRERTEEELKGKSLIIHCESRDYVYTYPEINYRDNIFNLLKSAKRGDTLTADISYYLCGLNEVAAGICLNESISVIEPYANFKAGKRAFEYGEGRDGREIDKMKLTEDIRASLKGEFSPVTAVYKGVKRKKRLYEVKRDTALLARFTTYYDGDNLARASNIRLAAAKLDGTVLEGKKTLSFNDIVGARVKSRGFLPAKIISNGEFTEGVGGGVCQVSTTLYNAALLSGLEIAEYHPHSLGVSYVPPSRDAMVSGSECDLKIFNPYEKPVYVCAYTDKGSITFEIYGKSEGVTYSLSSKVTGTIPAPEESCDDPQKSREGRDGLTSEGYLTVTRGGYSKRIALRKDRYAPLKRLVYEGKNGSGESEQKNL